ncbi:MAG: HAD-IA family hydrolase [Bacteroidota bacterium]
MHTDISWRFSISAIKRLSCVVFDIDGTLTETNELIFAAFNYVAEKYLGKRLTPEEITAMFGPTEEVAIERLIGKERHSIAMADFFEFYKSNFRSMAKLHPGMDDVLRFLKQKKLLLAVFTGKGSHSTEITLEQLGIRQYFDMVVTGHDVSEHKPSSEGIQKVLERYSLDPEEVLMIGDAVADVKAAREAGIFIAAVVWDSYAKEKVMKMETDYLFHDVKELREWLENVLQTN